LLFALFVTLIDIASASVELLNWTSPGPSYLSIV
jgi:hypothetical protein